MDNVSAECAAKKAGARETASTSVSTTIVDNFVDKLKSTDD